MPPPSLAGLAQLAIWHSVFFRNGMWLSYLSPVLLKRGVMQWMDLVQGRTMPKQLKCHIAPTWRAVYAESVKTVANMYRPNYEAPPSPPVDQWGQQWT